MGLSPYQLGTLTTVQVQTNSHQTQYHHHHLSLNCEGGWGTTDMTATPLSGVRALDSVQDCDATLAQYTVFTRVDQVWVICFYLILFLTLLEAAVQSLKKGKSAGVDNIPAKLVQAGGEDVITTLTTICNKIWQTGEWPTP